MSKAVEAHTDDSLEQGSDTDGDEKRTVLYLLNSPAYMSTVMRHQLLQEMQKTFPENVQGRVKALKNVQLEHLELEAKFYEDVYQLEKKYQALYQPLHDKRKQIVAGEYEPTDAEKVVKMVDDEEEEVSTKMALVSLEIRKNLKQDYPPDVKGVPDFWLTIFRCTELLSPMIQDIDEPVLKKLIDIKIVYSDDIPMSYTLEFHFAANEYFTNTVLTKQYYLKSKVDGESPFSFEGPEIYKCDGCVIHWNKNKNLTVKTIHKKQKHKARGAVRTVTKQVPTDSFFNFFNPPQVSEDEPTDIDTQNILATDFEIGHFLRARIIPKAVLFFTGDVVDDDDDDFDEEEEEEEEDDEEEDSDENDDAPPPPKNAHKHKGGGGNNAAAAAAAAKANPAECQQQ